MATLEYWLECGIAFCSGDSLEFPAHSSPAVARPEVTASQSLPTLTVSSLSVGDEPSVKMTGSGWSGTQTVAQPHAFDARLSTFASSTTARREALVQTPAVVSPASRWERGEGEISGSLQAKVLASQPETLCPPVVPSVERPAVFAKMVEEVASCEKCLLAKTRSKTVFGVGTPDAQVVFVGEGPGADEDLQGEPFVGAAGGILEQMLRSIALQRSQVFVANVVKCRPPGNRNPSMEEISLCQGYLFRQLELIRPKIIFCLGKFALLCLTGYSDAIGRARGKPFFWRGIPIIASYHPAYYLRSPGRKSAAWEDLIRLAKLLEQAEP